MQAETTTEETPPTNTQCSGGRERRLKPAVSRQAGVALRTEKGNATMNGNEKSDGPIVPKKPSNKDLKLAFQKTLAERGAAGLLQLL